MISRTTVLIVCCCLLISGAASGVVVGATQTNASTAEAPDSSESTETANACFPDDGFEFTIGNQGPEINMVLHLSLLTNLGGPGTFGVELTGSIGGPPIIELRTGVVFSGIDSVSTFLNDPFGPFSIAFEYVFELPMFGEEFSYEETESPVDGPVDDATC